MDFTRLKNLANKYKDDNMDAFLIQLVKCVEDYTKDSIERIKKDINDCGLNKQSFGDIFTLLSSDLDDKSMKSKGWYAIDDSCSLPEVINDRNQIDQLVKLVNQLIKSGENHNPILGHTYFVCESRRYSPVFFDDKRFSGCLVGKSGKKYSFLYSFQFSDMVLKKERILGRCNIYYPTKTPIIFNPFGRRVASLYILTESIDEIPEEILEIDLCYADNGLDNFIAGPSRLYWNVKIQEEDIDFIKNKAGEENRFVYIFNGCDSNSYIIPTENAELITVECQEKKKIIRFREDYRGDFIKITISHPVISKDCNSYIFMNKHEVNNNHLEYISTVKERVRSEADVVYTMNQLGNQFGVEFEKVTREKVNEYQMVNHYNYECRYKNYDSIRNDKMRVLYLWFRNIENSPFIDDYINYICDYMTGMYPDFQWRGGYK